MAGPFVSDELFPITIKYVEKKTKAGLGTCMVVRGKEMEQRYKDNAKEINTQWRIPNWKESQDLVRQCYRWDQIAGEKILDWNLYRMKCLDTYMVAWDVTMPNPNGGEQSVPCTPANVAKLQPLIASALVDEFMLKTSPTDEDMGN